jgi:hypothetical protein
MPPQIGQGYQDYIGTRTKPGQTQVEYYNKQNNMAFENPQQLFGYASTLSQTPIGSFDQLAAGFTPRAQALEQITQGLNQQQNQTFQQQQQPAQRQSSVIQQGINTENKNLTDALAEFNTLKTKMTSLQVPNYQQEYNTLRTQAGVPGIENDFANNQKNIRELPYVNRQNMGNAGVATEGQLSADTQQKGIPLEIQQANLLDRLKLAGDFVNNSLKFKEMDSNAARESLGTAIDLVMQSVNLSRQQISDYQGQQDRIEARAAQFTQANNITGRFYKLPGSDLVFDSQTLEALPFEEYKRRGGIGVQGQDGGFADVQEVQPQTIQEEHALVLDYLSTYKDAGITPNDSLSVAQSKIKNSKIYQDQVRGPVGSGGGGSASSGGLLGLTNQQIDNISPLVTQFQSSPIVQNYNTIGETINAVRSLGVTPTDDIQRIYAFAKVMDPASAVREGEYKTIQDYSTALLQRTGLNAKRVFTNDGFLTDEARGFLTNTLENRFKASERSYQNLYEETSRRVNLVGNTDKGGQLLNNYGGAFTPTGSSSSQVGPVNPAQSQPQEQEQTQSFWKKATNWLWGDN